MSYPKSKLKQISLDIEIKEEKLNNKIVDEYNYKERDIKESDLRLNVVYKGVKVSQRSYYTNDYVIIENDNKYYVVMRLRSKDKFYPLVIDLEQLNKVRNFETEEGKTGNWNFANKYISFSRKNKKTMYYLHNVLMDHTPVYGKSIDHLNRIKYDNRLKNLKFKTQSDQNVNQRTKKCFSKYIKNLPNDIQKHYEDNRVKYIYYEWHNRDKYHKMIIGPKNGIFKTFRCVKYEDIPELMQKAEDYLIEEAKKKGMKLDEYTSILSPEVQKLESSYYQIVKKALHFFDFEI